MVAAETLTVELTGCSGGVGVGLDATNCVDLLRPGSPAEASSLRIGDRVISWNGQPMVDPATGKQRLLKDVVVAADTHTLTVKRAIEPAKDTEGQPATDVKVTDEEAAAPQPRRSSTSLSI